MFEPGLVLARGALQKGGTLERMIIVRTRMVKDPKRTILRYDCGDGYFTCEYLRPLILKLFHF
jgi:hypothetical protein